jgi:hypothetical protein
VGRPPSFAIGTHPLFFVSVASKGFNVVVSSLFAALAETRISVAAKRLRKEGEKRQRSNEVRKYAEQRMGRRARAELPDHTEG